MRQGKMKDLTIDDVKRILRDKVEQTLKHIHHFHWDTNRFDEKEIKKRIEETQKKEQELKDNLKKDYKGTLDRIEKEVEEILRRENIIQDKKNVDYKGLIGRWTELRILRESWKRELLNNDGKNSEDFKKELEDKWKIGLFDSDNQTNRLKSNPVIKPQSTPKVSQTGSSSPRFSVVYHEYLEFMKRNKRRLSSIGETEISFLDFIEIIGDKPISDYTRNDARDYRNALSRLPKNRKKVKDYRDSSLKEILSMDVPDSHIIGIETQTKLNSRIVAFWNFLVDEYNDFVNENVFKKTSTSKVSIRKKDKKDAFTKDDMKVIFNPDNYLGEIFDNKYQRTKNFIYPYYFIPILAVHTGCRLEEICMIKTEDIVRVGKIWVYRLRETGEYGDEETKVKTQSSERDVPLHPVLVETLGFVKYVQFIKKKGHERVFHELPINPKKKTYHKNVGRFFNERYLKKIGLKPTDRKLSFHSFRHSVETHLTEQNVNPRYIDYLQGHAQNGVGGDVYLKGIPPEQLLKNCVQKIDWGIDFSQLKIKLK